VSELRMSFVWFVSEYSFVQRPPSLIAAACICSAINGLADRTCSQIVQKLHRITSIDEVRLIRNH